LLGTDSLGDATYSAVEQHFEGCPECKAVLERLAHRRPDPTVVLPGPGRWPRIPGFEIQSELGRGAMGVVYLAIETGLVRLVALKILPGAPGPDAGAGPRRRWLREVKVHQVEAHFQVAGAGDGNLPPPVSQTLQARLEQRSPDDIKHNVSPVTRCRRRHQFVQRPVCHVDEVIDGEVRDCALFCPLSDRPKHLFACLFIRLQHVATGFPDRYHPTV